MMSKMRWSFWLGIVCCLNFNMQEMRAGGLEESVQEEKLIWGSINVKRNTIT